MKYAAILLCFGAFVGCSSIPQFAPPEITPPALLIQHSLPAIPIAIAHQGLTLDMNIYIAEDGTVRSVQFKRGSGDSDWDAQASTVIKQWKYSPARLGEQPIRMWVHQSARIELADPVYISLGTILCKTQEEADSIYEALNNGKDFAELARDFSKTKYVAEVDIHSYPSHIQKVLMRLETNACSSPVKYGEHYAIFKKL